MDEPKSQPKRAEGSVEPFFNEEDKMNELIKIERQEVAGQSIQTVNARDLHEFLGSKQQYADWVKNPSPVTNWKTWLGKQNNP